MPVCTGTPVLQQFDKAKMSGSPGLAEQPDRNWAATFASIAVQGKLANDQRTALDVKHRAIELALSCQRCGGWRSCSPSHCASASYRPRAPDEDRHPAHRADHTALNGNRLRAHSLTTASCASCLMVAAMNYTMEQVKMHCQTTQIRRNRGRSNIRKMIQSNPHRNLLMLPYC